MRNADAQVRELFNHVRKAVDLLEQIMLQHLPSPEVQQKSEVRPPSPDRPAPALPQKMAYSIKEVVELCAISRASLYLEIAQGRLRVVKRGHRTLVLPADLQQWLSNLPASRVLARSDLATDRRRS